MKNQDTASLISSHTQTPLEVLRPYMADVWGLPIYVGSISSFCKLFCKHLDTFREKSLCIASPEMYALLCTQRNEAYRIAMRKYILCLPDGRLLTILARMKSASATRCRGADMMRELIRSTAPLGVKHFLLGSTKDTLLRIKEKAEKEWNHPRIVGIYAPPFVKKASQHDYNDIAARISRSGAEIVWIGLGTPKQDFFTTHIANLIQVTAIFPVGAAFNFHSGNVIEAPKWIQNLPIPVEWIYRIYREPRRLLPRYLYTLLWSPYYLLRNMICRKMCNR